MSLIALRNFSAPFTHKASLVTLALVVLLFGILRLTIGSRPAFSPASHSAASHSAASLAPARAPLLKMQNSQDGPAVEQNIPAQESFTPENISPRGDSMVGSASASFFGAANDSHPSQGAAGPQPATNSFSDGDVLSEILGTRKDKKVSPSGAERADQGNSPTRSGELDAIEKRLGMR